MQRSRWRSASGAPAASTRLLPATPGDVRRRILNVEIARVDAGRRPRLVRGWVPVWRGRGGVGRPAVKVPKRVVQPPKAGAPKLAPQPAKPATPAPQPDAKKS